LPPIEGENELTGQETALDLARFFYEDPEYSRLEMEAVKMKTVFRCKITSAALYFI